MAEPVRTIEGSLEQAVPAARGLAPPGGLEHPVATDTATILRSLRVRGPRVMWLLGAGASASSNVPTADDLMWEFRRDLYCSREGVSVTLLRDLGDASVQRRLLEYVATQRDLPLAGARDEYAALFEAAYPNEGDRRAYLDPKMQGARASYGYVALSTLMILDQLRLVWTTNFDPCVEDAHARMAGTTGALVSANPETCHLAEQSFAEGRWPVLVKLHGDFRYRQLKNTPEELRNQDATLRRLLVAAAQQNGLAVVGYSGRDRSVMDALRSALEGPSPFPSGLFWFHRPGGPTLNAVAELIEAAKNRGVEAHLVRVPTFDELGADVLALHDLPPEIEERVREQTGRRPQLRVVVPSREGGYPLIRLNAVSIDVPTQCRRVHCAIGGAAEVKAAVEASGLPVVAARRAQGVLAFGHDDDVRAIFESYGIEEFDVFPVEARRLGFDSAELGLLYDALRLALVRALPLLPAPGAGRAATLAVDPNRDADSSFTELRRLVGGTLSGTIGSTGLRWSEGVRLRLERRLDRTWLCLEPTVTSERGDVTMKEPRAEFLASRRAHRYNRQMHELLGAWQVILTRGQDHADYSAFNCKEGVDACFRIWRLSAFSAREQR